MGIVQTPLPTTTNYWQQFCLLSGLHYFFNMKLPHFCYLSYFKILPTTVIVHCCMQLPMLMFQSQHIVHINFRPWFDWGLVWSWGWGYKVLGLYACHDLGIHNTCDGIVTIFWFSYPHILKVVFRYCQTGILFVPQNKSCVQCIFSWGMCYLSFCQSTYIELAECHFCTKHT